MRKKNILIKSLAMCLLCMPLVGCGSASSELAAADTAAVSSGAYTLDSKQTAMDAGNGGYAEEAQVENAVVDQNAEEIMKAAERKLIREVSMTVETREFDQLLQNVTEQVELLGGYIESSAVYSDSFGADTYVQPETVRNRNGRITARIPKEKLDAFVCQVSENSNVVYRSEQVKDVTLQYVDLESHKKALLTEQERLFELLGKAETVEDIIQVESRLSEVRYQLESMESRLRTFDNQIDYSTVYLEVREVARITPTEQNESVWERIWTGFSENVYRVGKGLQNFAIGFVISLPIIFVWAVIIVILVFIVRVICKWRKGRKQKKESETVQSIEGAEQKAEDKETKHGK
ncbi:MAG: DUF4349 domain-containing protein [Clostridiales bacterium]|nr:DUF4349 domain-containing protein [Clostridiales bacterium]